MKRYVLDTTVIADHGNRYPPGADVLCRLFEETSELFVCDVVACEALSGGSDEQLAAMRRLLSALEFVALSPDGAAWAGMRRRERIAAGKGKPSTTDALIAALANSLNATVVTRNAKDFAAFDVPVLDYSEPAA